MWFSFAREDGFPTQFADQHSPAHTDILLAGLFCAFVIVVISVVLVLPAYTSHKRFIFVLLYTVLSLFIGGAILHGNFGHAWEIGNIELKSPYKPASSEEIAGRLGLHIALRGINITLKAVPDTGSVELKNEVIDYNEHFSWVWTQGRFGFGPYAGQISRDFRAAVVRGLPIPILQLAEYFTFDGEGIRFGRHYRLAGWYTHFLLWCASGTWILSNILLFMVAKYGGFLLSITGIFQVSAILTWATIRNSIELSVPFESKDGLHEVMLTTTFAFDFYVVLCNGLLCIVLGVIIYILDFYFPERLCEAFGIDPLSAFDEVVLSLEEAIELDANRHAARCMEMDEIERPSFDRTSRVTFRRRKTNGKSYYYNTRRQKDVHAQAVPSILIQ